MDLRNTCPKPQNVSSSNSYKQVECPQESDTEKRNRISSARKLDALGKILTQARDSAKDHWGICELAKSAKKKGREK
jgi:hypothetical protein